MATREFVGGKFSRGWNAATRLAVPVTWPLTRTFVVVGTGVDPVTSRFSDAIDQFHKGRC